jgi:predicted TIM-barrel fold metal-dependent hydrolase
MTGTISWRATEEDLRFYERELASFIPDRVFDAHTHLWQRDHAKYHGLPDDVDYSEYRQLMEDLHPGRRISALFIPAFNNKQMIGAANAWTAEQAAIDPFCRGEFFVRPQDDPEWVRDEVRRLKLHGLKCYHTLASVNPTWEAQIPDYLPERLIKVAHEEGWVVTLHMVRSRAVADPGNIHWIRHYCENYPNMTLILAHSARGFQPSHNLEGLPKLTGLENLYFDTSANCEPMAHQTIIRIIGHKKLMYGSDLPASHQRGRSAAVSDTFLWLAEDTPVWNEKHLTIKPTMVGLEHLRSLKWACWSERLSDTAVEDIFWRNASELFGL